MKTTTYTERKLLVEQERAFRKAESLLRACKKEWEKVKTIQKELDSRKQPSLGQVVKDAQKGSVC